MSETRQELEQFLYPSLFRDGEKAEYGLIQKIFACQNKTVLFWMPGREENYLTKLHLAPIAKLIGYTGKSYKPDTTAMEENEPYILHWLGIDVDDVRNMRETSETISRIMPHASIRLSTGGHGLHVITRINPLIVQRNASRQVEEWQKEWVISLESEGIKICKYDSRCFFLFGGENRWIKKSEEILPLLLSPSFSRLSEQPSGKVKIYYKQLNPAIRETIRILREYKAITPYSDDWCWSFQGVWIKEVHDALKKESKFFKKFHTKSPMKSAEKHINGWITISPVCISIRGFADSENCFEIFDGEGL